MDNEKELWDRLEPETDRAFEAFRTYLSLPSSDRTLVAAYRRFVGNPNASKVSDAWNEWARRYAWKERARAYDNHIDRIRRNAMEKAIEEEAAEQARQAERIRNNLNELMVVGHLKTMEFLEELDPSSMRFSDAVQVARLFMEHVDKFGSGEEKGQETWTEDDDEWLYEAAERAKQRRMERDSSEADPDAAKKDIQGSEGSLPEGSE